MMASSPNALTIAEHHQEFDRKSRTHPKLHPGSPQQADIKRLIFLVDEGVRDMASFGPLAANAGASSAIMVDRGCGTGPNTVHLSKSFASAVRKQSSASPVTIHNDRPHDGIVSLSEQLASLRESSAGTLQCAGTFPLVAAGSFLDCLMPTSVHMVVSNAVAHWLDLAHVSAMPDGASLHNADRSFARIAERQWRTLLDATARELVPGGKLILSFIGCSSPETRDQHVPLLLLRSAAERVASEAGFPAEFGRSVVPIYLRTRTETLAPLIHDPGIARRFLVEYCEVESCECPFFSRFSRNGDALEFAKGFTRFIRGFSEWAVALWLTRLFDRAGRPCIVSDQLGQFYSDIEQAVYEQPLRWRMRRHRIVLAATRTAFD